MQYPQATRDVGIVSSTTSKTSSHARDTANVIKSVYDVKAAPSSSTDTLKQAQTIKASEFPIATPEYSPPQPQVQQTLEGQIALMVQDLRETLLQELRKTHKEASTGEDTSIKENALVDKTDVQEHPRSHPSAQAQALDQKTLIERAEPPKRVISSDLADILGKKDKEE